MKGSNTSTPTGRSEAVQDWAVADVQEFVPQGFEHVVSRSCHPHGSCYTWLFELLFSLSPSIAISIVRVYEILSISPSSADRKDAILLA